MKCNKQVRELRTERRPADDRDSPDREVLTRKGCMHLLLIGENALARAMRDGLPCVSIANTYRFVRSQVIEWLKTLASGNVRKQGGRPRPTKIGEHTSPEESVRTQLDKTWQDFVVPENQKLMLKGKDGEERAALIATVLAEWRNITKLCNGHKFQGFLQIGLTFDEMAKHFTESKMGVWSGRAIRETVERHEYYRQFLNDENYKQRLRAQ